MPFSRGSSQFRYQAQVSHIAGRFSTTEPPEKPMILDCAVLWLVALSFLTVCHPMECSPPGSSVYGDSPGKNTGVGCHALLQGIFLTQGLNPGPPALQADSLPAELPGKPSILLSTK